MTSELFTLATFFALELFGTRATLWLAAGVNLIVAVVARHLDRQTTPIAEDTSPDAGQLDAAAPVVGGGARRRDEGG